jgi:hypothetical protein
VGGQDLGKLDEIVESYENQEEDYEEWRNTKAGKALIMNDETEFTNHITSLLMPSL